MNNKTSHILNTASNLLGFCFFILTSIKTLGIDRTTLLDEVVGLTILFLAISIALSFFSMRSAVSKKSQVFENWADYLFLSSVLFIVVVSAFIFFEII